MSEKLKDIDSERMLEYLLSKFVEVQIKDNINELDYAIGHIKDILKVIHRETMAEIDLRIPVMLGEIEIRSLEKEIIS